MVNYIPILTTIFAIYFFSKIFAHYRKKPKAIYLLWWTIGVATYGFGTLTESINAVAGWSPLNTKIWYIMGALLGGFPLAQGSVYLLMKKKLGHVLSAIWVAIILFASVCIIMSPIEIPPDFNYHLTGKVLAWKWVRLFSPFINTYSLIFLVGGACFSAWKYSQLGKTHSRFLGNVFIAVGGLLPGIGGTFTRFGHVEVLYVTELLGLILMFTGYITMQKDKELSIHKIQVDLAND